MKQLYIKYLFLFFYINLPTFIDEEPKNQTFLHVETTDVYFKKLADEDILSYVNSGKCMDKAGSYGIQECDFVDHIEGDYTNVVGLPKYVVETMMKDVAL